MSTLTSEELHQHIAEIAPNAVDVMSRAMSMSPNRLMAAVERGEITNAIAIAHLVKWHEKMTLVDTAGLIRKQAIEIVRLRERVFELETDPQGGDPIPLAQPRTTVIAPLRADCGEAGHNEGKCGNAVCLGVASDTGMAAYAKARLGAT